MAQGGDVGRYLYWSDRLGRLFAALPDLGPRLVLMRADHGEAFGEDGYSGHGIAHPSVWTVPYTESVLAARSE